MIWKAMAAIVATLVLAVPARGQSVSVLFGGQGVVSATTVNARLTGSLAISFRGDRASCAARGVCSYSGVLVWQPTGVAPNAFLSILVSRQHGRVSRQVQLGPFGLGGSHATVSSVVTRSIAGGPAGTCADASPATEQTTLMLHRGQVTVRALGGAGSALSTRCAGPLEADIAPFLPATSLPLAELARGGRRIDLSGTRSFAAGGFTGTISSSLVLGLQGVHRQRFSPNRFPRARTVAVRYVTVPLRIVGATGGIQARFAGAPERDTCVVLDSCALAGTLGVTPRPVGATGQLFVFGPVRRPLRDFLAALGLSRRGHAAGIEVSGGLFWSRGGSLTTAITRPTQCHDAGPLGEGGLTFTPTVHALRLAYLTPGPLRLRCPGPQLTSANDPLAQATLSLRRSLAGEFSVTLAARSVAADDGYTLTPGGRLRLTIRRGHFQQRVIREPPIAVP